MTLFMSSFVCFLWLTFQPCTPLSYQSFYSLFSNSRIVTQDETYNRSSILECLLDCQKVPGCSAVSHNSGRGLCKGLTSQTVTAIEDKIGWVRIEAFTQGRFREVSESTKTDDVTTPAIITDTPSYWKTDDVTTPAIITDTPSYWKTDDVTTPAIITDTPSYWKTDDVTTPAIITDTPSYWKTDDVTTPAIITDTPSYWTSTATSMKQSTVSTGRTVTVTDKTVALSNLNIGCPGDFILLGEKCYLISKTRKSLDYQSADDICNSNNNAELAAFETTAEYYLVRHYYETHLLHFIDGSSAGWVIGGELNQIAGEISWITGSGSRQDDFPWSMWDPDLDQGCLGISMWGYDLYDWPCDDFQQQHVICEL